MFRDAMDSNASEYAATKDQITQDFFFSTKRYQADMDKLSGENLHSALAIDREFFENLEKEV